MSNQKCRPIQTPIDTSSSGPVNQKNILGETLVQLGTNYEVTCKEGKPQVYRNTFYKNGMPSSIALPEAMASYAMRLLQSQLTQSSDIPEATSVKASSVSNDDEQKKLFLAHVLFAEAGGTVSLEDTNPSDRYMSLRMLATCIQNRKGRPGFGKHQNAYDIVNGKNQFQCVSEPNNLWRLADTPDKMGPKQKAGWKEALRLADELNRGTFKPLHQSAVYFHDKSIDKPSNWDNKYYKTKRIAQTKYFYFYEAIPKAKQKGLMAKR